jgi:monooxygenase
MPTEHLDVLIIGAGLSGIGAACHLQRDCPDKTYAIVEARDAIGGTWDLFRYPGVRSDSDMFTLGYSFRPWTQPKAIADGPSIRDYIRATARERGVDRKVRFGLTVVAAEWSTAAARWTITLRRTSGPEAGTTFPLTASFVFSCTGYYRYDQGYAPPFDGEEEFQGTVVHPQHWPEDLDYSGKRVVVIGSGATAVTLVPAMAPTAAHVTMVQRSPSYVLAMPSVDALADVIRRRLPDRYAYPVIRWKNALLGMLIYQLSKRRPRTVKKLLRRFLERQLPAGYDIDTHFSPRYNPWDQRLCLCPDGDLMAALSDGSATVETVGIDSFTPTGIKLADGREIPADIIVTATGLNLLAMGGVTLTVDGQPVDVADTVAYKGVMLSGIPNYAFTVGYTNASWTLRADLVDTYVCRLLNHMDQNGYQVVTPLAPPAGSPTRPLLDLSSGYIQRGAPALPKQGPAAPWRIHQNYLRDRPILRRAPIEDKGVRFSRVTPAGSRRPLVGDKTG